MDSIWKKLYIFVCMEDRHESIEKVFSAIKSGDQRAFERVFRMFYVPLCDYAAMILGEQAEAEDVVQDLFMHIWRSRVEIEVQDSVKSYLFTSVRFRALNVLKHKMVERKHGACNVRITRRRRCNRLSKSRRFCRNCRSSAVSYSR